MDSDKHEEELSPESAEALARGIADIQAGRMVKVSLAAEEHTCPHCGARTVKCPKCGEEIVVAPEPEPIPYSPPIYPQPYYPIYPQPWNPLYPYPVNPSPFYPGWGNYTICDTVQS